MKSSKRPHQHSDPAALGVWPCIGIWRVSLLDGVIVNLLRSHSNLSSLDICIESAAKAVGAAGDIPTYAIVAIEVDSDSIEAMNSVQGMHILESVQDLCRRVLASLAAGSRNELITESHIRIHGVSEDNYSRAIASKAHDALQSQNQDHLQYESDDVTYAAVRDSATENAIQLPDTADELFLGVNNLIRQMDVDQLPVKQKLLKIMSGLDIVKSASPEKQRQLVKDINELLLRLNVHLACPSCGKASVLVYLKARAEKGSKGGIVTQHALPTDRKMHTPKVWGAISAPDGSPIDRWLIARRASTNHR